MSLSVIPNAAADVGRGTPLLDALDRLCWQLSRIEGAPPQEILSSGIFDDCVALACQIGCAAPEGSGGADLTAEPGVKKRLGFARGILLKLGVLYETQAALAAIDGRKLSGGYIADVSAAAVREGQGLGLGPDSCVLFIGCGPYPTSAMGIADAYGCRVECLDCDPYAAILGERVVRASGLNDRINVALGEGSEAEVSRYSHIWIAGLVPDKEALLNRLGDGAAAGLRVLARYGNGFKWVFNYGLRTARLEGWRVERRESGVIYAWMELSSYGVKALARSPRTE